MLQSVAESETLENDLELLFLVVPPNRKILGHVQYASKYWPEHYKESENLPRPVHRVLDVLQGSMARSWYRIYQLLEAAGWRNMLPTLFSRLHSSPHHLHHRRRLGNPTEGFAIRNQPGSPLRGSIEKGVEWGGFPRLFLWQVSRDTENAPRYQLVPGNC